MANVQIDELLQGIDRNMQDFQAFNLGRRRRISPPFNANFLQAQLVAQQLPLRINEQPLDVLRRQPFEVPVGAQPPLPQNPPQNPPQHPPQNPPVLRPQHPPPPQQQQAPLHNPPPSNQPPGMPEGSVIEPVDGSMEEDSESPKPSVTLRDASSFIDDVSKYYNSDELSDIVLRVGDKDYPAHKFILGKSSEVFKSMLFQSHWTQSSMEKVQLEEPEDVHDVFDRFLKFMYTSEVSVDADSVIPVLCLADKYNVAGLRNLCTSYMVEQAKLPHAKHAVNYYCFAKALCVDTLMDQCIRTNAWHAEALLKSPDWLEMEVDMVEDILKTSELVLRNEMSVFKAVKAFVFHVAHVEHREDYAKRLLPLVRFPQMLIQQLYDVETDAGAEFLSMPEVAPLLAELVARAYRFRALCPSRNQLGIEDFKNNFYQPRDYLDLCVDSINMANALRFQVQVDVRMFSGPVPAEVRDADWRVVYRRPNNTNNLWSVSFIPSESAMKQGNGEARIEASLIILDERDVVVSLIRAGPVSCTRSAYLTIELDTTSLPNARTMQTIIKPTI